MRKDESKEPQESAKEVTPSKKPTGNAQSSQSAQAGLETEKEKSESAEARDTSD